MTDLERLTAPWQEPALSGTIAQGDMPGDKICITEEHIQKAQDYIDRYNARYPKIHDFMQRMIEEARETGRAVTLFGRYRELPDIRSKNFMRRSLAERMAMNTPIQGTAADIMKMAMIAVYDKLRKGHYKSRVLLQVHDELVAEVVAEEKEEIAALLKETMESVVTLKVPLLADVHAGKNWAETK